MLDLSISSFHPLTTEEVGVTSVICLCKMPTHCFRSKLPKIKGNKGKNKINVALAGNRTRASRVAGENSTTEPPVQVLRKGGKCLIFNLIRKGWPQEISLAV